MFCPKCNTSVTPLNGRCPECQRPFAVGGAVPVSAIGVPVEAGSSAPGWEPPDIERLTIGAGWEVPGAPSHRPAYTPIPRPSMSYEEFDDDEDEETPTQPLRPKQTAAVEPRKMPPRSSSRAAACLLGGFVLCLATVSAVFFTRRTGNPAPSAGQSTPAMDQRGSLGDQVLAEGDHFLRKKDFAEAAHRFYEADAFYQQSPGAAKDKIKQGRQGSRQAKLAQARELLPMARKCLDDKDYNGAINRAEKAIDLLREAGAPLEERKKATAIIDLANRRMVQVRLTTRPEATPAGEALAQPELPSLGEGPSVPTGRRGQGVASHRRVPSPAAAPPQIRPKPVVPRAAYRPPPSRPSEPRLGDQGVLPGYNSGSRFR